MTTRSNKIYILSGILLLATAILKLISAVGHAKILKTYDPVFFMLTTGSVLSGAGIFEIIIGLILILNSSQPLKWHSLAFMCACFWSYRIGVLIVKPGKPCPCLGTVFGWFPWLNTHAQHVSLGILVFFMLCLIVCKRQPQINSNTV